MSEIHKDIRNPPKISQKKKLLGRGGEIDSTFSERRENDIQQIKAESTTARTGIQKRFEKDRAQISFNNNFRSTEQ